MQLHATRLRRQAHVFQLHVLKRELLLNAGEVLEQSGLRLEGIYKTLAAHATAHPVEVAAFVAADIYGRVAGFQGVEEVSDFGGVHPEAVAPGPVQISKL